MLEDAIAVLAAESSLHARNLDALFGLLAVAYAAILFLFLARRR